MALEARVVVRWDGREWDHTGEVVSFDERFSLWEAAYRPREIVVRLPMGDLRDWIEAGHHHHTIEAEVFLGARLVAVSAVARLEPGRSAGEWTELELAERPLYDGSQIPSSSRLRVRYIDVAATERAAQRAFRRGTQDMYTTLYGNNNYRPINMVGGYTWETQYATRSEGRVYPLVFGSPGTDGTRATAALPIDLSAGILMVAGHEVSAGSVVVHGPGGGPGELEYTLNDTLAISHQEDVTGQRVAVVDVSTSTVLQGDWVGTPEAAERQWMVSWSSTASGLPGGAADVVTLLLAHTAGITIDLNSVEGVRDHLRGYELDGVIDEQVSAWDVLVGQVLPILPVRLIPTVGGVGLAPVRLDYVAADARWHLREGFGIVALGRPAWRSAGDPEAIKNDWTVSYSPSRVTRRFRRAARRGPATSSEARRSAELHGTRSAAVETRWVYRTAVADRIALDMVRLYSPDRRQLSYAVDAEVYGRGAPCELAAGMPVLVTDAAEGITGRVAVVSGYVRDGTRTDRVQLVLL